MSKNRRSKYPINQWIPGERTIDGVKRPVLIRRRRVGGKNTYDIKRIKQKNPTTSYQRITI